MSFPLNFKRLAGTRRRQPRGMAAITSLALLAFAAALLVGVVVQLPAQWADRALSQASGGVLRLASPAGTLWSGQAQLQLAADRVLATADPEAEARNARPASVMQPIPGLLRWQLQPSFWGDTAQGVPPLSVVLRIEHPALRGAVATQPMVLGMGRMALPPGELRLPEIDLQTAGGPLALMKPRITPLLRWDRLVIGGSSSSRGTVLAEPANATIELAEVSSRLSPVRPLGTYRLTLSTPAGPMAAFAWSLQSSESSVLALAGNGRFDQRLSGQLELRCRRNCEFVEGLMAAVGQKNGDRYVANLGL